LNRTPIFALLVLVLAASVWAQNTPALPAQPLGPDDLLSLTVPNSPELTHQFRVGPDAQLRLPFIPTAFQVRGRMPEELAEEIRAALKTQRMFVDPIVNVSVLEYGSRPVTVMGAVRRPTTFQASPQSTLLDALAHADGLAPEAGSTIWVTRPKTASGEPEIVTIQVQDLLNRPQLAGNIRLYGGEQVRVPEAPRVYVLGNVKRPCTVPVKDPAETTVLKVLTQAEGVSAFTASEAVIYRPGEDGRKEIVLDLKGILKGASPDVRLQAYDVLYVPEAKGRRMTVQVLDRLLGFGSALATGFIVYHP
jgi:polysaccharide export outer membrane protein